MASDRRTRSCRSEPDSPLRVPRDVPLDRQVRHLLPVRLTGSGQSYDNAQCIQALKSKGVIWTAIFSREPQEIPPDNAMSSELVERGAILVPETADNHGVRRTGCIQPSQSYLSPFTRSDPSPVLKRWMASWRSAIDAAQESRSPHGASNASPGTSVRP